MGELPFSGDIFTLRIESRIGAPGLSSWAVVSGHAGITNEN